MQLEKEMGTRLFAMKIMITTANTRDEDHKALSAGHSVATDKTKEAQKI